MHKQELASRMPRRLVEIVEFPQWKFPPAYGKSSIVLLVSEAKSKIESRPPRSRHRSLSSVPTSRLGKLFPKTVPKLCQNCAKNLFFVPLPRLITARL